jgi:hypothetical protein
VTAPARHSELLALVAALDDGGVLAPTSLTLSDPNPDYDRVQALARYLGALRDATAWWIGDLILYAETTFGEEAYQLDGALGRSPDTLRRWAWVARAVPPVRRRTSLSFTHHEKVAKLSPAEQAAWLDRAEEGRWATDELGTELRAAAESAAKELPPWKGKTTIRPGLVVAARAVVCESVRHRDVVPPKLMEQIDRLREALDS